MLSSIQLMKAVRLSNVVYNYTSACAKRPFLVCKDTQAKTTYIVFRGCKDIHELVRCSTPNLAKVIGNAKVNATFMQFFDDVHEDVLEVVEEAETHDILFAGHSAGGALAQIAYAIVELEDDVRSSSCISIGSPYVGNQGFRELIQRKGNNHYRVVSRDDPVTCIRLNRELVHNGKEIVVDTKNIAKGIEHHSCNTYAVALKAQVKDQKP